MDNQDICRWCNMPFTDHLDGPPDSGTASLPRVPCFNLKECFAPVATPDPASSAETPANNIKYAGRPAWDLGKRKVLKRNDPIIQIRNGTQVINLPPADFQKRRRVFYHESAARIVRLFPRLYKLVRSK